MRARPVAERRRRVPVRDAVAVAAAACLGLALGPAAAAGAAPAAPTAPAPPVPGCAGEEPPEVYRGSEPWAQSELAAATTWPFGRGGGVTVALLSSGVDASNDQLTGAVASGFDALSGAPGADTDCDGRGTRAAGVLAARSSAETAVHGVAPEVQLLPVRVVQRVARSDDGSETEDLGGGPEQLADGITWAVEQGARIICVTVTTDRDDPALQAAVGAAVAAGALIVSGGPVTDDAGGVAEDEVPLPRYPSAYPQVLAVGALGRDGALLPASERGRYLDILAPAAATITTASTGGRGGLAHAQPSDDPAAATAAVAGALALVLGRDRDLTGEGAADRVVGSALPAPRSIAGTLGPADESGASPAPPPVLYVPGAVTAHLGAPRTPEVGVLATPVPDRSGLDLAERRALSWAAVLTLTGVAVATAAVVIRSRRTRSAG